VLYADAASDVLVVMQAALSDGAGVANVFGRAGVFDELSGTDTGVFFEAGEGTVYAVLRSDSTETRVAQADWNLDALDGAGPSGVTLDPASAAQRYVFAWDAGADAIRVGVAAKEGGEIVSFCHAFADVPAADMEPYRRPRPVAWEIGQVDSGAVTPATASMVQGRAVVYVRSAVTTCLGRTPRSADTGAEPRTMSDVGGSVPLFSLRLKDGFANAARLLLDGFDIVNRSDACVGRWEAVLNATLGGDAFADVPDSVARFTGYAGAAGASATDGTVLARGYLYGSGETRITREQLPASAYAAASIAGAADTLTLRVTNLGGVLELWGAAASTHNIDPPIRLTASTMWSNDNQRTQVMRAICAAASPHGPKRWAILSCRDGEAIQVDGRTIEHKGKDVESRHHEPLHKLLHASPPHIVLYDVKRRRTMSSGSMYPCLVQPTPSGLNSFAAFSAIRPVAYIRAGLSTSVDSITTRRIPTRTDGDERSSLITTLEAAVRDWLARHLWSTLCSESANLITKIEPKTYGEPTAKGKRNDHWCAHPTWACFV